MGIASIHSWQFLGYLGASPLHISKIVIAEMFLFCRRAPLFWTFLWGLVGVGWGWVGIMLGSRYYLSLVIDVYADL